MSRKERWHWEVLLGCGLVAGGRAASPMQRLIKQSCTAAATAITLQYRSRSKLCIKTLTIDSQPNPSIPCLKQLLFVYKTLSLSDEQHLTLQSEFLFSKFSSFVQRGIQLVQVWNGWIFGQRGVGAYSRIRICIFHPLLQFKWGIVVKVFANLSKTI